MSQWHLAVAAAYASQVHPKSLAACGGWCFGGKVGRNELQHPPVRNVHPKVPDLNENPVPHIGSTMRARCLSASRNDASIARNSSPRTLKFPVAGLLNALRGLLEPRPSFRSFRALEQMMDLAVSVDRARVADA